jgi:hypothetical protein
MEGVMMVRLFITSKQRLTLAIEKNLNGSYSAYEIRTCEKIGITYILHSWSLDWLIDTLCMRYVGEILIAVETPETGSREKDDFERMIQNLELLPKSRMS